MEHKNVLIVFAVVALIAGGLYYYSTSSGGSLAILTQVPGMSDEDALAPIGVPSAPDLPSSSAGAAAPERVIENGVAVSIIYLTELGFSPHEATVNSGEEVRFVNRTDGAMRIGAVSTASSQYYAGVNQPDVVGKGGTYQIGLIQKGLWTYQNLTNPKAPGATGVIYVR